MHIKFMAHGTGSGAAASAYLMGDLDHKGVARAGVEVLRGDPVLFGALADSLPFQQRYTSAVISWATEEAPTEDEINAVLDDFEKLAFAGLDRQDVHLTAVLHREEDGGVHVHILIPRVHLGTGKSLNVAPPSQRSHFDSLRNKWNYGKGWARPDDPLRRRPVQPSFDAYRDANDPKAIKQQISEYLLGLIAQGVITNAADLRRHVVEMGCEITRSGTDHLSIKPAEYPKAIRLKGEIYGASWTVENTVEREDRAAEARRTGRGGTVDEGAERYCQERLERACEGRAGYNRQRYEGRNRTAEIGHEAVQEGGPVAEAIFRHLVESVSDRRVPVIGARVRELGVVELARQRDPAADHDARSHQGGGGHREQRQGVPSSPPTRDFDQHERRSQSRGGAVNDGTGTDLGRQAGANRDDTQRADRGLDAAITGAGALFGRVSGALKRGTQRLRDAVRGSTARLRGAVERRGDIRGHDQDNARSIEHQCRELDGRAEYLAQCAEQVAALAKVEKAKGLRIGGLGM